MHLVLRRHRPRRLGSETYSGGSASEAAPNSLRARYGGSVSSVSSAAAGAAVAGLAAGAAAGRMAHLTLTPPSSNGHPGGSPRSTLEDGPGGAQGAGMHGAASGMSVLSTPHTAVRCARHVPLRLASAGLGGAVLFFSLGGEGVGESGRRMCLGEVAVGDGQGGASRGLAVRRQGAAGFVQGGAQSWEGGVQACALTGARCAAEPWACSTRAASTAWARR